MTMCWSRKPGPPCHALASDMPYYCVGDEKTVSLCIALDRVPKATSLRCVAGSHLRSVNLRPKRFDGTDLYGGDRTAEMPGIDGNSGRYEILFWDMQPARAVAFGFRGPMARPAISVRKPPPHHIDALDRRRRGIRLSPGQRLAALQASDIQARRTVERAGFPTDLSPIDPRQSARRRP
jgi:ectoine hydroxylase-related dioxygenase (phytanoyl-CoA dioxygenase family)